MDPEISVSAATHTKLSRLPFESVFVSAAKMVTAGELTASSPPSGRASPMTVHAFELLPACELLAVAS